MSNSTIWLNARIMELREQRAAQDARIEALEAECREYRSALERIAGTKADPAALLTDDTEVHAEAWRNVARRRRDIARQALSKGKA